MRIDVTQEDIRRGRPRESDFCPVALALNRATGEYADVSWCRPYLGLEHTPLAPFSKEVSDAIYLFDRGYPIDPFSFEIDWPPKL